jgi:hypothetical protein
MKLQHAHLHILQHDQIGAMGNDIGDQESCHPNNNRLSYINKTWSVQQAINFS